RPPSTSPALVNRRPLQRPTPGVQGPGGPCPGVRGARLPAEHSPSRYARSAPSSEDLAFEPGARGAPSDEDLVRSHEAHLQTTPLPSSPTEQRSGVGQGRQHLFPVLREFVLAYPTDRAQFLQRPRHPCGDLPQGGVVEDDIRRNPLLLG